MISINNLFNQIRYILINEPNFIIMGYLKEINLESILKNDTIEFIKQLFQLMKEYMNPDLLDDIVFKNLLNLFRKIINDDIYDKLSFIEKNDDIYNSIFSFTKLNYTKNQITKFRDELYIKYNLSYQINENINIIDDNFYNKLEKIKIREIKKKMNQIDEIINKIRYLVSNKMNDTLNNYFKNFKIEFLLKTDNINIILKLLNDIYQLMKDYLNPILLKDTIFISLIKKLKKIVSHKMFSELNFDKMNELYFQELVELTKLKSFRNINNFRYNSFLKYKFNNPINKDKDINNVKKVVKKLNNLDERFNNLRYVISNENNDIIKSHLYKLKLRSKNNDKVINFIKQLYQLIKDYLQPGLLKDNLFILLLNRFYKIITDNNYNNLQFNENNETFYKELYNYTIKNNYTDINKFRYSLYNKYKFNTSLNDDKKLEYIDKIEETTGIRIKKRVLEDNDNSNKRVKIC